MKLLIACLAAVSLIPRPAPAQELLQGRGEYRMDVDVARFYGDSSQTYVELYYGIRESMLSYTADSTGYHGSAYLSWIIRKDSVKVSAKQWLVPHPLEDTARLSASQMLTGIESVGLPPGTYTMSLTSYDMTTPARRDSVTLPLVINEFPSDREALSDIELCTSIQSSTNKKSIFYKNTLEVVPNVARVYGTGLPMMYYYVEAYNLGNGSERRPDILLRFSVLDATGKEVLAKERTKPRLHRSSVEIGTLNLSALRGGTYLLKASMIDTGQHALAVTTRKFFVYRPGSAPDTAAAAFNASAATSEFGVMTEQEIDRSFGQAIYIANQLERDQYLKLSGVEAKRNFIFEFWRRRDTDPSTPVNEFKDAYARRVDVANRTYAVGSREGWKTDRGRVYLVYGQCDEVERFPSTAESLPYEIWHYNALQGGVIFVFVDRTGLSDYLLVHSTHRDELRDENWFERWAHKAQ